jgi:hypothetical protein
MMLQKYSPSEQTNHAFFKFKNRKQQIFRFFTVSVCYGTLSMY